MYSIALGQGGKRVIAAAAGIIFCVCGQVLSDVPNIHRYTTEHWIVSLMEDRPEEVSFSIYKETEHPALQELYDRVRWWPEEFGTGAYADIIVTMLDTDEEPMPLAVQWRNVIRESYQPDALHQRALEVLQYIGARVFRDQMISQGDEILFEKLSRDFPEIGQLMDAEKAAILPGNALPVIQAAREKLGSGPDEDRLKALIAMDRLGWDVVVPLTGERDLFEMYGAILDIFETTLEPDAWEKAYDAAHAILGILGNQENPGAHLFRSELDRRLLPAFPGAAGGGKYARGGRGGDVYHVINLNDSGPGSLRHGLETADGPRTIVFQIAGTIYLESGINVRDKPFLTIAGQTAPPPGITIAYSDVGFTRCHHLILQNIRFAPGDKYTRDESEDHPDFRDRGRMDGLRVRESNFVMIDRVVAKWASEQTLSTTSGSSGGRLPSHPNNRNLTVQYSMIVESFVEADHNKGIRGFGTLLRGSHSLTWHHNLFVHNRSRVPALRDVRVDWVNNVLYNGNLGYANERSQMNMNMAGNVYIHGPDDPIPWGTQTESAFYPGAPYHYIYHSGPDRLDRNYHDKNPGRPFELIPAGDDFIGYGEYTRFDKPLPISDISIQTGRQAYIDVLSRSGIQRRDMHDHRIIREVISKAGGFINRQSELTDRYGIEPWPEPAVQTTVINTAGDGIADNWKLGNGLNVHKPMHTVRMPDGYTLLEKYLHSITPYALSPVFTRKIEIKPQHAVWREDAWILIFDVSGLEPGSFRDAWLYMETEQGRPSLPSGEKAAAADKGAAAPDKSITASVLARDYQWDGMERFPGYMEAAGLQQLLEIGNVDFVRTDQNVVFDNPNLAVVLNLGAHHYHDPNSRYLTLVIKPETQSGNRSHFRLVVDAVDISY